MNSSSFDVDVVAPSEQGERNADAKNHGRRNADGLNDLQERAVRQWISRFALSCIF